MDPTSELLRRSEIFFKETLKRDANDAHTLTHCKRKGVCSHVFTVSKYTELDEAKVKSYKRYFNGSFDSFDSSELCTNIVGGCGCIHAEQKMILELMKFLGTFPLPCILLNTYSPCTQCANLIVESRLISVVIYRHLTEHDVRGASILNLAGLTVYQLL